MEDLVFGGVEEGSDFVEAVGYQVLGSSVDDEVVLGVEVAGGGAEGAVLGAVEFGGGGFGDDPAGYGDGEGWFAENGPEGGE